MYYAQRNLVSVERMDATAITVVPVLVGWEIA
jgi:hypothetical protein